MQENNFPALHGLVQHLPFPLVLFDTRSGAGFANRRFAELFGHEAVDDPALHRLAQNPGDAWQPFTIRKRDGRELAATAQAIAVVDNAVLLIFDGLAAPVSMQDTERLQRRIAELENVSATDALTGAWNRAHLERMMEVEIGRANRTGQPVTFILLDVDNFKGINDVYGHLLGDEVLKELVVRIRERVRDADTLYRWGGEEFVVLATSVGYRGGVVVAEDLRKIVGSVPFAKVGTITVSLGVAEYIEGETAQRWFQRADRALYAAKSAGRNCVHVDRQGSSDLHATRAGSGVLRLNWLEAYECGEPTIDAAHRELFDRGNALIAAAIDQHARPGLWRSALDSTLVHLAQHFQDEETLLSQLDYARIVDHQRSHARLVRAAGDLKAAVEDGEATLGDLVNFLVNDVISLHILKTDRDFFSLFRS